jgi:hypothetical protein
LWLAILFFGPVLVGGETTTISVRVETRTGGSVSGLVVDHNDHGLVIVSEKVPYVFAWRELTGGSAYQAKKQLLELEKGGAAKLGGLDHFALGQLALLVDRADIAATEFRLATDRKGSLRKRVDQAWKDYNASMHAKRAPVENSAASDSVDIAADKNTTSRETSERDGKLTAIPPSDVRAKVRESYLTFGEKVRETLGKDIQLLETDHFLIWTDWRKPDHAELINLCETMYRSVCSQFNLDPTESIFLSKCPIFCFQKKARFRQFAQKFDGYSGKDSVGYTRSLEKSGHVHVAIYRQGNSALDRDRFASTLVHEGTHAVIHRLFSSRLIPHWVNEGYAELVAQRVLGDRCVAGGNASLLALQYVRYDWPIGSLLESSGPISVHQYPTAHSVVAYMEGTDAEKFGAFVAGLKAGAPLATALERAYDGLTLEGLEIGWRAWVRAGETERSEPRSAGETADN